MLAELARIVDDCTAAFEAYDYARSLERTERFFWSFCDELRRAGQAARLRREDDADGRQSAAAALQLALSTLLRLFAPILPFVTEEVWSWWQDGSIHRAAWPDTRRIRPGTTCSPSRWPRRRSPRSSKAKSEQKKSLASAVDLVEIADNAERLAIIERVVADVCAAGKVANYKLTAATASVAVTLAAE